MLATALKIKRASDNILAQRPRMRMMMTHDPEEIICSEVIAEAARIILEGVDRVKNIGTYRGEFKVEECDQTVLFTVNCMVVYSPFIGEENVVTGVEFYDCVATTINEAGKEVSNDFTEDELAGHMKS